MKKIKKEKGITLVALIITIVVLLILAVVSIGAVKDSDIIGHAKDAAGSFNEAKNNELDAVSKYETELDKYAPAELNNYGFYYNVDYICYNYFGDDYYNYAKARLLEDGTYIANTYQEEDFKEGDSIRFSDFTGTKIYKVDSLEFDKEYTETGSFGCKCKWKVDRNGDIYGNIVLDKDNVVFSFKNVNLAGALNCVASEDGKSFDVNGKIFSIE